MEIIKTPLKDLILLKPKLFGDQRGWFIESYSFEVLKQAGYSINFVQDNHSFSEKQGTLRGLHFQIGEKSQTKLVRCTRGEIMDVVVDLRKDSPTYLKHYAVKLSEDNFLQLLVPKGFAHGFITLKDASEIQYKVDEYYNQSSDSGIIYNDPTFNIAWSSFLDEPYVLSEKDSKLKQFSESEHAF